MTGGHDIRSIALVEPSFHIDSGAGVSGTFQVDERAARVWIDSHEWLAASVAVGEQAGPLLRRLSLVRVPVKVVPGPRVISEVPCGDVVSSFAVVRAALHAAFGAVAAPPADPGPGDAGNGQLSDALLDESRFEWTTDGQTKTVLGGGVKVDVTVGAGMAVFHTRLLQVGDGLTCASAAALAHYLLALNGALRVARGAMSDREVALEALIPVATLNAAAVDRAVNAIAMGAAAAARSCAALRSEEVARSYLEFHTKGRTDHADADR
jgi:hypothetical protein